MKYTNLTDLLATMKFIIDISTGKAEATTAAWSQYTRTGKP